MKHILFLLAMLATLSCYSQSDRGVLYSFSYEITKDPRNYQIMSKMYPIYRDANWLRLDNLIHRQGAIYNKHVKETMALTDVIRAKRQNGLDTTTEEQRRTQLIQWTSQVMTNMNVTFDKIALIQAQYNLRATVTNQ